MKSLGLASAKPGDAKAERAPQEEQAAPAGRDQLAELLKMLQQLKPEQLRKVLADNPALANTLQQAIAV